MRMDYRELIKENSLEKNSKLPVSAFPIMCLRPMKVWATIVTKLLGLLSWINSFVERLVLRFFLCTEWDLPAT